MNKLVIELSEFGVDGGGRNSKSIRSKWRYWPRVHQPCQKTHADGDNALSKTIMLQIYIPKAIEQSCWMCTLGRDWSALPRMPPLLNHFFRVFFFVFRCSFSPFISFVHAIQPDDVRHLVVNHKVTINFSYYTFLFSIALSVTAAVKQNDHCDHWWWLVITAKGHFSILIFLHTLCTIITRILLNFYTNFKYSSIILSYLLLLFFLTASYYKKINASIILEYMNQSCYCTSKFSSKCCRAENRSTFSDYINTHQFSRIMQTFDQTWEKFVSNNNLN